MKKIHILDTTLRDGEQTPGLDLSPDKKFEIARQLADLNVDVIEVGFPVSNESDFKACQKIAQGINGPTICVLARAKKEDIDAAYEAIGMTEKKRIHVFLATSKIHLEKKLMKSEEEVLSIIGEQIEYAKSKGFEVQFSPEDASRTSIDFMMESIRVAINSGATVINIPDTVGCSTI